MKKSQYFSPSVYECKLALAAFLQGFQTCAADSSREVAIRNGLDAVWEAARRHQAQLEANEQKDNAKRFVEVSA